MIYFLIIAITTELALAILCLKYVWSFWRCIGLQLAEIQFLSLDIPVLIFGIRSSVCFSKFPENFIRFIFKEKFCFVRLSFVIKVKFKFLAQFPRHYLSYPVILVTVFFSCKYDAYTSVIYYFIFITTKPTSLQDSLQYSGNLNNAVVWTVSIHPLISKHCSLSDSKSP